ncbi:MAG: hypothetical protein ABI411_05105 [Tahibacter sp.]
MNRLVASFLSILGFARPVATLAERPIHSRSRSNQSRRCGWSCCVFCVKGDVVIGKPLALKIPQYAWLKDGKTKTPVVVIQAEKAYGKKMVGALQGNGQFIVAMLADLTLLGQDAPR